MKILKNIVMLACIFAWSCGSVRVTSSWKSVEVEQRMYQKILVLGLINESDRCIEQEMEDHLVAELLSLGCNAIGSLKEYGPEYFDKMDEQAAVKKISESSIDAVLTIVLLDKHKERSYVV